MRTKKRKLRIGLIGSAAFRIKFIREAEYVNGVEVVGVCSSQPGEEADVQGLYYTNDIDTLLARVEAVYIMSRPEKHYEQVKRALEKGKHVLCESPLAFSGEQVKELYRLASDHGSILMEAIKTAYSTAFERLVLLAKSGKIGQIVSIEAVCTSLRDGITAKGADLSQKWNSMCGWAPVALLPVFQIFGTDYTDKIYYTKFQDKEMNIDAFTQIDLLYPSGVATVRVAKGAKAEGELVISGTKGYIYVPAPWWKTDYFEIRYEKPEDNRRFFYQLDGEGIRYEIVAFAKAVESGRTGSYVPEDLSVAIAKMIGDFNERKKMIELE